VGVTLPFEGEDAAAFQADSALAHRLTEAGESAGRVLKPNVDIVHPLDPSAG
jgi:uncharacterized cupin superfamily protein